MKLDLKCCCGAEFHGQQDGNFCIALEKQAAEWRVMHIGCASRFAPPMWSDLTTIPLSPTAEPLPKQLTITCMDKT